MEHQLIITSNNDNRSIVFQSTEDVEGEIHVRAKDVRSGLTKDELVAAAELALIFIKEH